MPVDAFYFHVEDTEIGIRGTVTLLDYGESAADVVRAAEYPLGKRVSHMEHNGRISYQTICAAKDGDGAAIEEIVRHYYLHR